MSKYLILKRDDSNNFTTGYSREKPYDTLKEAFIMRGVTQEQLDRSSDLLDKGRTAVVAKIIELEDLDLIEKEQPHER